MRRLYVIRPNINGWRCNMLNFWSRVQIEFLISEWSNGVECWMTSNPKGGLGNIESLAILTPKIRRGT